MFVANIIVTEINLFLLALLLQLSLEVLEFFAVRRDHAELFTPKIGWRIFFFFAGAGFLLLTAEHLPNVRITQNRDSAWPLLVLFFLWAFRPKTLVTNVSGLISYGSYGLGRSFIPWNEVANVTSYWDDATDQDIWTMLVRSPTVTVTSRDGTSVKFSYTNEGIGRFMDALRERVPKSAFDEGLCDWKP